MPKKTRTGPAIVPAKTASIEVDALQQIYAHASHIRFPRADYQDNDVLMMKGVVKEQQAHAEQIMVRVPEQYRPKPPSQ